jgi:hypothetical protein
LYDICGIQGGICPGVKLGEPHLQDVTTDFPIFRLLLVVIYELADTFVPTINVRWNTFITPHFDAGNKTYFESVSSDFS